MLNNRYVRTIILSRVLLQLGIWIRNFAVLLYVTDVTNNDPLYVSLISVVEFAPIFIFALIAGTFADRWKPKKTMVWCDFLSALSVVLVLVALLYGTWNVLLVGTFVSASLSQFSQPSAMKLFKRHVASEQLQGVLAMSQSLVAVFMVMGPIIGTFIFIQYGIEVSLLLTVAMFFGSALVLSLLPRDEEENRRVSEGSFLKEMEAGIRYLWNNVSLRALALAFSVSGLAVGMIQPLLIYICIEKLGQDKSFMQWLLMANGAAMLVGGILIMSVANKIAPQILLTIGLVVSALCTVAVGASELILVTIALQVISGFFYPCIQVGIQTMIIRNTKDAFIGRVGGAITPIFMGMMVIGMLLSGVLKHMLSLVTVYTLSGLLLLIGALLIVPLIRKKSVHRLTSQG